MTWAEFADRHAMGLGVLVFAFIFFAFICGADLIRAWRSRR